MAIAVIRRIETSPNSPNLLRSDATGTVTGNQGTAPVIVEAAISETHAKTALVTRHPVEDGADVSDYVRPGILGIEMEIGFSNNPLCETPDRNGVFSGSNQTRIQAAWDAMLDLIDGRPSRQLLQVQTGLKLYDNMVISSIGTNQTNRNPDSVVIRVQMEQVRIVSSSSVTVPARNINEGEDRNRGAGNVNGGENVAEQIFDCDECLALCAACQEPNADTQLIIQDGTVVETQEYQTNQQCVNNGALELSPFENSSNYGAEEKRRACIAVTNAVIADRGLFLDRPGIIALPPEEEVVGSGTVLAIPTVN